jgi:hypothetical protein
MQSALLSIALYVCIYVCTVHNSSVSLCNLQCCPLHCILPMSLEHFPSWPNLCTVPAVYVLYLQFSCWWLEIWYLATGVSEQPRWEGYVATKCWQPSTTITLSNFPKLLRFQLSRSLSVKSHTTPCRLVDKVIRIVLPSSAVNLKKVLLPFAVIYA